jgi:hypothetical protein
MTSHDQTNAKTLHEYPTPGSADAVTLGCSCSARRNNYGLRPPFAVGTHIGGSTGGWLIARDCALHAASAYRGALVG